MVMIRCPSTLATHNGEMSMCDGLVCNVGPNVMRHPSVISSFKVVTPGCLPVGCSMMLSLCDGSSDSLVCTFPAVG